MGIELLKMVKIWKHDEDPNPEASAEYEFSSPARRRYFNECMPLHQAALKGDWKAARKILRNDSTLINARITEGGETALHIAAVEGHTTFVKELLNMMSQYDLEILNNKESTALCFAAAAGHLHIAKLMVERNTTLPTARGRNGVRPLYMAAQQGYSEMAEYLFSSSGFQSWAKEDQIELLTACIDSGLYGLATKIVNQNKILAVTEDEEGETPLQVLARKPLAFCDTSSQGLWGNIASTTLRWMKLKDRNTSPPRAAYKLLDCLWAAIICKEDVERAQLPGNISQLLFIAAESGNDDFLVQLIRRYPDFLYKKKRNSGYTIFHIAVLHRHIKVFNLIYELHSLKNLMLSYRDEDGNNILHLAAKLAPQDQLNSIPGAALQMQREVLWYKEVEKIVQPSYRTMKNLAGQTPYNLFLAKHKDLMKEGEEQMKKIAKSCMLVAILIATVVFTTVFTAPGGYDNKGAPVLQNKKLFLVFPISEAVAILASLTSILMFLSILASRFSVNDFLRSLPIWMVVGEVTLCVSIVAMMVAFSACLSLYHPHGLATTIVFLVLFASVPLMFVILKYRLVVSIVRSTYDSKWIFRSNKRLS